MTFKVQRSAHTINHPYEALVTCGNGWGGGEYMTPAQLLEAAAEMKKMANAIMMERFCDTCYTLTKKVRDRKNS